MAVRILKFLLVGALALVFLLGAALSIAWLWTSPEPLPAGSESAARLEPGSAAVLESELVWVDESRPTEGHGDLGRSDERRFRVKIWYPEESRGSQPLAVYVHGFMSSRVGGAYLAQHLASHGYVVLAADFPLSHADAPGGPEVLDVVNQPADVSFLIDRVLALSHADNLFGNQIDTARIGVFGLSLGGLTSTLASFDPTRRDPRIAASISIAGPADVFGPDYFDHAGVPFLMIAGTSDAIIAYEDNAEPIPDRIRRGGLLTLRGATHIGFDDIASGPMRIFGNPDAVVCGNAVPDPEAFATEDVKNPFSGLFGTTADGLLEPDVYRLGCTRTFDELIDAGRQQMLTTIAVHAFFESRFASDTESRAAHDEFLARTFPSEIEEVGFEGSRR